MFVKRNKFLQLFLVVVALIWVLPGVASSAKTVVSTTDDGLQFEYNTDNATGDATLVGYTGTNSNVVIPAHVGEHPVTKISAEAFAGNKIIETVEIPETVDYVKRRAFADCTSLKEVTFANHQAYLTSVKASSHWPIYVETEAFSNCSALKSITFGYGVLGDKDILKGSGVKELNIYLTDWTSFSNHIFDNIESLEVINILADPENPDCDTRVIIGFDAFNNLPLLKEVNVYNAAHCSLNTSYYYDNKGDLKQTFNNCSSLKSVNLYFTEINKYGDYIYDISTGSGSYTGSAPFAGGGMGSEGCEMTSSNPEVVKISNSSSTSNIYLLKAGKATISKGTVPFEINIFVGDIDDNKIKLDSCSFTMPYSSFTYTGKEIVPFITFEDAENKKVLQEGTDYTVKCEDNISVGTKTVVCSGIGEYSGEVSKAFKIIPSTPSIKAVVKNTKFTVSVNGVEEADGYEIYYSKKKSSGYKSLVKTTTLSATTSKNISGKYIKIRAHKKIGKNTYYSEWSKPVKIK